MSLDEFHRWSRIEQRQEHRLAARRRCADDPAHRRSVEHRGLMQVHRVLVEAHLQRDVVQVQHLCPMVEHHALREAGRSAGVHQHGEVVLLRFVGDQRLGTGDQVLVQEVVRQFDAGEDVTDQHHVTDRARPVAGSSMR